MCCSTASNNYMLPLRTQVEEQHRYKKELPNWNLAEYCPPESEKLALSKGERALTSRV
jgi:hypothetical protein